MEGPTKAAEDCCATGTWLNILAMSFSAGSNMMHMLCPGQAHGWHSEQAWPDPGREQMLYWLPDRAS